MIGFEFNTFLHFVELNSEGPAQLLRCNSDPTFNLCSSTTCSSIGSTGKLCYMLEQSDSNDWKRITKRHSLHMKYAEGVAPPMFLSIKHPTSHISEESMDDSAGTEGGAQCGHDQTHSQPKRVRPPKSQRTKFSKFINTQKAKLAAMPGVFDIESVEIPVSLRRAGSNERDLARVKHFLYNFRETLIA